MKTLTFLTIVLSAALSFAQQADPEGPPLAPAQQVGWESPIAFSCSDADLVDFGLVKYAGLTHFMWELADGTVVLSVKGGQVDPNLKPSGNGEDFVQQHIIPTQVGSARMGFDKDSGQLCSVRRFPASNVQNERIDI